MYAMPCTSKDSVNVGFRSRGSNSRTRCGWFVHLIHHRTILVLSAMLVFVIGSTLWHVSHTYSSLINQSALENAALYSQALAEFRTIYTAKVVARLKGQGVTITHDYETRDGAIPLPATLSMELGKRIGEHQSGAETQLYSPYPFPWREESGGLRDGFSKEAWHRLSQDPTEPFYRFEEVEGRTTLRYATADLMRPACVNCHNTHPDTPKNDWKAGQGERPGAET